MIPVVSADEISGKKHFLEMLEVFHVLVLEDGVEVKEGDEGVFRIAADVNDLAAFLEDCRWKHVQW